MSDSSKITTDLEVDEPVALDARYRFDLHERRKVDNQIIGTQQHVVDSLISGYTGTWGDLHASSDPVDVGDCLCVKREFVTKAYASDLADAGAICGVVLVAASPGTKVRYAVGGTIPPETTGLGNGSTQLVKVDTDTARLTRTSSYEEDDYPAGICDIYGSLALLLGSAPIGVLSGFAPGTDLAGTSTDQTVIAFTGTTDTTGQLGRVAKYAGTDLNDGVVVQRETVKEYVIARETGDAGVYYEDSEAGSEPFDYEIAGQCANSADSGSNYVGGDIVLRSGAGVGTGGSGKARLTNADRSRYIDVDDDSARVGQDTSVFGSAPTTLGTTSGVVSGTTTTATTADQTIATLPIPSGNGSWFLVARVTEHVGTTQTECGMVVQVAHYNGSSYEAGSGTDGIPTDLSTNTLSLKATISSTNVVIKATPVSASSATHKIAYEWQVA